MNDGQVENNVVFSTYRFLWRNNSRKLFFYWPAKLLLFLKLTVPHLWQGIV